MRPGKYIWLPFSIIIVGLAFLFVSVAQAQGGKPPRKKSFKGPSYMIIGSPP